MLTTVHCSITKTKITLAFPISTFSIAITACWTSCKWIFRSITHGIDQACTKTYFHSLYHLNTPMVSANQSVSDLLECFP